MKKLVGLILIISHFNAFSQLKIDNFLLESLRAEKSPETLRFKIDSLSKGGEKDLALLTRYYSADKVNKEVFRQKILQCFPKGEFAYGDARGRFYTLDNIRQMDSLLVKLASDFPAKNLDPEYGALANSYAKQQSLEMAERYLNKISSVELRRQFSAKIAETVSAYDLNAAERIIAPVARQWKNELLKADFPKRQHGSNSGFSSLFETYMHILEKSGKYSLALSNAKLALDYEQSPSLRLRASYAVLLSKTKQFNIALPLLEAIISEDQADDAVFGAFYESFKVMHPGENPRNRLSVLTEKTLPAREITSPIEMIDEQCPYFEITDLQGRKVTLRDFAGKTLIIDFWATWCGPCKKSFPAMKLAVEKYKGNPNVKFLFIHTWETSSRASADAQAFLKLNGYNFDLYMDLKDPKTRKNKAVEAFGVKGIPAKFVVDAKGRIRYKASGFSQGNIAALNEISSMIDSTLVLTSQ